MIEFLDPENREEALIISAGLALHGLASNPAYEGVDAVLMTQTAFALAREFLRQAEACQP